MSNDPGAARLQLPRKQKNLVQLGAVFLTVSVACYGLALSTLVTPILESMDAMAYVSLFTILSSLGITIMTPIGGKLGDIFGRKRIVVAAGAACALLGVGMAFAKSAPLLLLCRLGLSLTQGAFMAAPYIIAGLINEKKDIPKAMGLLATAISVGGFGGSLIAGFLSDLGMLKAAILFPAIPLLAGMLLIGLYYPDDRTADRQRIDLGGILLLSAALSAILLPLNYGASLGWGHPLIWGGLLAGILLTIALLRYEAKQKQPIIPVHMLRQRNYMAFLLTGFLCYFYRGAMDVYSPLGAINVMGTSATTAGTLQLPRTVITIFLPILAGAWVSRKRRNLWLAMAVAAAAAALPMFAMGFTRSDTSVLLYFAALAVTGIAESFRGVSITPAAQSCLSAENMGVGTSLVNFSNSLSSSLAATVYGAIYNAFTLSAPADPLHIQRGVNAVFITAGAVSLLGLALVLFIVRPLLHRQERNAA